MKIVIKRTITETYVLENVSSQDLVSAAAKASYGTSGMPHDGELHTDWVERILADSATLDVLRFRHGSPDDSTEEYEVTGLEYDLTS